MCRILTLSDYRTISIKQHSANNFVLPVFEIEFRNLAMLRRPTKTKCLRLNPGIERQKI